MYLAQLLAMFTSITADQKDISFYVFWSEFSFSISYLFQCSQSRTIFECKFRIPDFFWLRPPWLQCYQWLFYFPVLPQYIHYLVLLKICKSCQTSCRFKSRRSFTDFLTRHPYLLKVFKISGLQSWCYTFLKF